jgi:hypothetical protein
MGESYLGIEIGGTKLQIVRGDPAGQILERRRFTVDVPRGGAGIREQLERTLPELLAMARPAGVGVGFGGPVDWRTGQICCSHQVAGWSDFALGDWLQSITGLPARVDNDANTAALGEAWRGAGVGFDPVFYVTLGSGVGGGLVAGGRIYHGAQPGEAEIGHVRLDRDGTIVESRCSGWAVDARIRRWNEAQPESLLARLVGQARGARDPPGDRDRPGFCPLPCDALVPPAGRRDRGGLEFPGRTLARRRRRRPPALPHGGLSTRPEGLPGGAGRGCSARRRPPPGATHCLAGSFALPIARIRWQISLAQG